ncbi:hypothetical protein Namu_0989 [Nakamurella multipartita DSM 44233]|jgi:uncharacterized membrane protein YgaE (UPF0421/DUF939 family)|uniref:Integral membrane bound transporter domain-containing protein n=2 Tax=Nakamurella TaxID=53460 RepID=C8XBD6_NAKMY|nr:hypothetical protein Namu_0989 [Nakamurella multipartita DSM 44233]
MAGESGAAPGNRAVRRLRSLAGLPPIDRAAFGAIARTELPQIARIVIVAAVGWQVCLWLGAQDPPIYAVLVPLVSLKSDPFSAFNLSWSRLVGVLIGLLLGLAVLRVMSPGLLAISVVLAASLLLGMLVRIGNQPNMQVAVSALLVFSNPDASAYGLTRLWETGVGTAVTALLTPFLFPADPRVAARAELAAIAQALTSGLRDATRIAGETGRSVLDGTREMLGVIERLDQAQERIRTMQAQITSAARSAGWSVLRRGALREVGRLEPTRQLAARSAVNIQAFAEEVMTFAERFDFDQDAQLRPDSLRELTEPLAQALDDALAGREYAAALARARAARQAFVAGEHTRVASITRRPLNRILEDLERAGTAEPPGSAGAVHDVAHQ